MRNGILALMGEIVIKVLSKEDLDDAAKKLRDQLLDKMEVSTMPEETNAHKTYYENLKKNVHTCSHVIPKPLISQSDQLGYKINRHDKTFNHQGHKKWL